MAVSPIPAGYHSVTPYLVCNGAAKALEFYKNVFAATVFERMDLPDGRVAHAEMRIGDSVIMMADEHPEMNFYGPHHYKGSPVGIMVYVPDVDATWAKALAAGGKERRPLTTQFYGDRNGTLEDPFGHVWTVATHVEDVAPEEMQRRFQANKPGG